MKKDGSFSFKKKSTNDLSEIIDFEVNPSEKKRFENINKIIEIIENKNGKKKYKKITYIKNKDGKEIQKEEPKKKQLNILMKMIWMKEIK